MLINDRLEYGDGFSTNEKIVAEYILKNRERIESLSITEIARDTFTSPSTTNRLANKLGFKGYKEFKKEYVAEISYTMEHLGNVDPNIPFQKNTKIDTLANNISHLLQNSISDTCSALNYEQLEKSIRVLQQAETIYVYGYTLAISAATDFRYKMQTIGKRVQILDNTDDMYYASYYMNKNDAAIVISYSGETKELIEMMRLLKRNHVPMIALTSMGDNSIEQLADLILHISTREKLFSKITTYASGISIHYLLDLLFSGIYQKQDDTYWRDKFEHISNIDRDRKSHISILNEDDTFIGRSI